MLSAVHFPRRAILGNPTNDTFASFKGTCSILGFLWSEESNLKVESLTVSFRLGLIIQEEAQFAGGFCGVITLNSRQLLSSFLCPRLLYFLHGVCWAGHGAMSAHIIPTPRRLRKEGLSFEAGLSNTNILFQKPDLTKSSSPQNTLEKSFIPGV